MTSIGFDVAGAKIHIVILKCAGSEGFEVIEETTWPVQKINPIKKYGNIFTQVGNLIDEYDDLIVGVGASQNPTSRSVDNLYSAEVRGVVIASIAMKGSRAFVVNTASATKEDGFSSFDTVKSSSDFWRIVNGNVTETRKKAAYIAIKAKQEVDE